MRKVFTLVLALALVLSTAAVFAQEDFEPSVNVGGEFAWGYNYNHGEDIYVETLDTAEATVDGAIDPFNTFGLTVVYGGVETDTLALDAVTLTTDLGALFGAEDLGFGLNWTNGYTDPGATVVSGYTRIGLEDDAVDNDDLGMAKDWTSTIVVPVLDVVTLTTAWNWDVGAAETTGDDEAVDALLDVVANIGGASVGVYYATNQVSGGAFGADVGVDVASFVPAMGDAGVGLDFGASVGSDLGAEDADASGYVPTNALAAGQTGWGLGTKVSYAVSGFPAMLDLGVSYYGSTEVDEAPTVTASPNTVIGIDGGVMLFDMVELYGGAALDYTDYEDLGTATNLDGLAGGEFGTNIMVGNATFTIGYYFVNEDFSGQYATGSIESFADGNAATDEDGNAIGHAFFNTAWSY